MPKGAITGYIDVAQLVLYAFWIFFAGLIYYLHRENKREGYPLESDRSLRAGRVKVQGWPAVPAPKTFLLRTGETVSVPRPEKGPGQIVLGKPLGRHLGAPLVPTVDGMLAGIGPGATADRADVADTTDDGLPRVVPLRRLPDCGVATKDRDPRGLPVVGCDKQVAGTVTELWMDRAEQVFRYLEVSIAGGRSVLLPMNFSKVGRRAVSVEAITAAQFAGVPPIKSADEVTLLEEERVAAYYGAGTLYATPRRAEPLL